MHNAFKLKKTLEKAPQHLPEGCYKCSQARPGSVKLPLGGVPVARILLLHTHTDAKKSKKRQMVELNSPIGQIPKAVKNTILD